MFKYLVLALLFYMLYKFVFHFVLPVYRATKRFKQQVANAQQKVQEQFNKYQEHQDFQKETAPPNKRQDKSYIDFEEVK